MPSQVLIIQSDSKLAQRLAKLFTERGDQIRQTTAPSELFPLVEPYFPDLIVVDLQLANNSWQDQLQQIQQQFPETKFLFTTHYPDSRQETQAKAQYNSPAFLRHPFNRIELERVLANWGQNVQVAPNSEQMGSPKVRVPVRVKITIPYVILALLVTLAAAYVVSRVVLDSIEERFTNQLIEAGKLANDWMVQEENRLLETLRLVSHTQGVAEAVEAGDAEQLRELVLPLAVNYQEESIEILDLQGASVLSLRHKQGSNAEVYEATRAETLYNQWIFVQNVLERRVDHGRDKYAGLARAPWGDYFYVAGPILDDDSNQVGVILVGKSLPTLVRQIRQDILAHITIYDLSGRPIATTLFLADQNSQTLPSEFVSDLVSGQETGSLKRSLTVASINYSEIVGFWQVRALLDTSEAPSDDNILGLIGVSLAETFLVRPGRITRLQVFGLAAVSFLLVIALGVWVANRITRPLMRVVAASAQVAEGNLEVQVDPTGDDEVAVLAHSFNEMIAGLREGSLYRDLLGRTVSPEVREQLRQGFASGQLRLEGQEAVATVLMSDIRSFTTLSEAEDPGTILNWLNEFFSELVPIITAHGGVISKFEGDAVLAFFGILPRPLPAQESAYQACQTALAMLNAVERLNARRVARSETAFTVGIGINTGPVIAGGLGSTDRLHYTIIGDTVNTTARLESLTRLLGEVSGAVISQHTLFALQDHHHEFQLESLGAHTVKGKVEQLLVYHLKASKNTV